MPQPEQRHVQLAGSNPPPGVSGTRRQGVGSPQGLAGPVPGALTWSARRGTSAALGVVSISTYPPRECGIGAFSRDLLQALGALPQPVVGVVAAVNGAGARYEYGPVVRAQMEEGNPDSYVQAARQINRLSSVDLAIIQHDFGKFGLWRNGFEADYLLPMLEALEKPVVVTLHSVTPQPNALMRQTIQGIGRRAQGIVVMANVAKTLLREHYGLDSETLAKVRQIPHGVPSCAGVGDQPSLDGAKDALGLAGRVVLSTFGLLGEGKGIEYAIEALPPLVERHPDLLYLVIGETHPEVRKLRGETYRRQLVQLAEDLGVGEHVRFVNRFLPQAELLRYLAATDVYVTPYLARYQVTSGTLAYALGCGKAIVSTPYLYAAEALAEGRGILAEFQNAASLANAIGQLLTNPSLRRHVERRAAHYGQEMGWERVAGRYRALFASALGRDEGRLSAGPSPLPESVAEGPRRRVLVPDGAFERATLAAASERQATAAASVARAARRWATGYRQ